MPSISPSRKESSPPPPPPYPITTTIPHAHPSSYKNDVNETKQDDEDDDEHDDNETDQNDDDEEQTESDDDGDDFVHPKLTTHDDDIIHEEETDEDDSFDPTIHTPSRISSSDDEDSDNEVEGTNVEGAKSDEDATYEEDQGNEAVEDTNTDLDGRDDVMTDVILPQVQATQEIEDTHVTLTPVNPDGQQQSSSVSSGFVSNMLNPNQDTGVDDIFGQHTEATSLIDTPVTAIMEPSFTAQINRPPTPYPLVIQTQQPPILTPATTTSSSLQNLPNFASLFGFDYRLKALEDNFSELRQTNQYAEALSSIPSIVDQYLANKMQEAVDVAVQLKYDRIREESTSANQQFLDSIDEGMKKIIKEQVKKEVSKITPKIEKLVTDQLESEVLVRSSKEANTSHAVAANLSELELKKILIDKMEANNSINRSDIQRQLYKALVDAYEADKILLDTYGVVIQFKLLKRPRDGADDDQEEPPLERRGSKKMKGKEKNHASTSAPTRNNNQSCPYEKQEEEASNIFLTGFQTTYTTTFPVMQWNKGPTFELMKGTCKSLTELEYFCEEVYKATTKNLELINPEGRQYPHDLRQPLPLVPNSQGRLCYTHSILINNDRKYLRGGVVKPKGYTSVRRYSCRYGLSKWIEDLVPNSMWSQMIVKYDKFALWGISHWGKKRKTVLCICDPQGNQLVMSIQKDESLLSLRSVTSTDKDPRHLKIAVLLVQGKVTNLNVEEPIRRKLTSQANTYRSNLRRQDAYTPYSDPRGFIYENKDKKNKLMRIDELHKFSDGTLDDVRTALNDRLKGIRMKLKALEDNFSELRQTNQYAEALSSIPSIVDQYLANKMQEAVDVAVQLKYDRIREESTTANQQFLDSIDEGMKKIIKEQVKKEVSKITPKIEKLVTDQLESEVLVRSSKEANTSHAVAANLSELELKKILIDKMEANNSINRSDIQRQLYRLCYAYEADKILLDTYGDTVTIKRPRDGADDDQEPSAGTDRGSKRRRSGKEPASTSAPSENDNKICRKTTRTELILTRNLIANPLAEEEVQHLPDWFQQPTRLPSPDHAWNKSVPAVHESVQPWLSNLAQRQDPRESFDELTDSTFDFSAFVMNRLNVQTLTPELLAGPTFELMKGTCKSLTELEYFCEEVYKATTEKLDWINPEGRQYPHDLRQPLPLVPNSQGRHVIPFHHFINNDLEYLRGGVSSRKYSTSVTKTTAADYGHIKWIEDLVPNSMWSQMIVKYDKFALWGISHWGKKRRQFYAFATSRESARDVYSKQ
ncbi:hypothetical protein Tco_0856949 [Tanacetum coccineum]|uniref:Uncharacterized protein n=1 Tax=Tanacetum coccineum TaxID=301880 RepID=A0ABQ5B7L5_9ASTR